MFIVFLNIILSSIVLIFLVCAALLLTAGAIALIIVSLVRSAKAKKRNQKTRKVGLWIGIVMLIVPWIVVVSAVGIVKVSDKASNRWNFDRAVVAEAIADKDADDLYELMSPYAMDKCDLTEDDLQAFLDKCGIENNSSDDMERYTSKKSLGKASDPKGNHYRPDGNKFVYRMYYVNDEGAEVCVIGILYDSSDKDKVGIYYIEYREKDSKTGKSIATESFGVKPK